MTMLFDQGYVNEIACKEREAKGRAIGREEGTYNTKIATARKALDCNIPRDVIATITGLTPEEVAAL